MRQTFDALNSDGTNRLKANDIGIVWDIYKSKKLQELENETDKLKGQSCEVLLENFGNGSDLNIKQFKNLVENIRMSEEEVESMWRSAKRKEIEDAQKALAKTQQ